MKKIIFNSIFALLFCMNACADNEKIIAFEQLPQNAQAVVTTAFKGEQISYVTEDKDLLNTDYEVRFQSGAKVEFDQNGNLKKVDCNLNQVPDQLIPQQVLEYVKAKFPNAFITEYGKDDRRWKAELSNKLELIFDKNYNFVGIDD
ncbi:MAG: PepSY-like domain-containing protein [Paludibacteraceae bacterium]|nr:PepSY-like domain-containing protein [Paludibacteraceae bacterium]